MRGGNGRCAFALLLALLCGCPVSHPREGDLGGTRDGGDGGAGRDGGLTSDGGIGHDAGADAFVACGCFPPTVLCDPALGRCVECWTDGDCPGDAPRCHGNACVQCLASADCIPGAVCLAAQYKGDFACAPDCRLDGGLGDCGRGQVCDSSNGVCVASPVPFGSCQSPADCPVYEVGCDSQIHQCGLCVATSDCPAGLTCVLDMADSPPVGGCVCDPDGGACGVLSPATPTCLPGGSCGCTSDGGCPAGTLCVQSTITGASACMACGIDAGPAFPACSDMQPPTLACDADAGRCVGCLTDADCRNGETTLSGPLLPDCIYPGMTPFLQTCGCRSADDCPAGDGCDFSYSLTGVCLPRCDLAGGKSCIASAAGPVGATAGSIFTWTVFCQPATGGCAGCLSDADCASLYGALAPVCQALPGVLPVRPGAAGGVCGCAHDSDCAADELCDAQLGVLEPSPGSVPGTGFCVPPCSDGGGGGVDCATVSGGAARVCQPGGHCVQCGRDADCPQPNSVFAGYPLCETDAGVCSACLTGNDCPAGKPGCVPGSGLLRGCGLCRTDADCLSPATCEMGGFGGLGLCRYTCNPDGGAPSCPVGQPHCGSDGRCLQCVSNTECPPHPGTDLQVCDNGFCTT